MLKRSFTIHGGDIFLNGFLLARPSQDVFLLLPLIPWIEQGGSVYFLLRYSMIFLNVYEVDWLHYDTYISVIKADHFLPAYLWIFYMTYVPMNVLAEK